LTKKIISKNKRLFTAFLQKIRPAARLRVGRGRAADAGPARRGAPGSKKRRRGQALGPFLPSKAPPGGAFPVDILTRNIVKNATKFFFHFKRRKCLTGALEREKTR